MTVCGCLLLRSLLGVKRTSSAALHMSAYDPKRTWGATSNLPVWTATMPWLLGLEGGNEASRVHQSYRRCDHRMAAGCTCAAATGGRLSRPYVNQGRRLLHSVVPQSAERGGF